MRLDPVSLPHNMGKMWPYKLKFYGHALACLLLFFIVSCSRQSPKVVTVIIDNVSLRHDVNGKVIDAHGGCLQFFDGRFYLYGNAFGTNLNDAFLNCPFAVYSSPNLKDWTLEGNLLKESPKGFYYRPYVVFNPKTKKYVLWYNWYKTLWKGQAGVAVSDSPVGPFTVVTEKARLRGSCPGDGSLFVDDDGAGYYIYTDIANDYALRVERLTPDFLDSTGGGSDFLGYGVEAPLLFRRNDLYYVLCGPLCADCPQGSQVSVLIAQSPLGPYYDAGQINDFASTNSMQASSDPSVPQVELNDNNKLFHPSTKIPFIRGQETWVARFPTAGEPTFIWMADGWKSAKDGTRGHDFQYWGSPLKFNPDGTIQPLKFSAYWTITWRRQQ
jgi:hypothetical protein